MPVSETSRPDEAGKSLKRFEFIVLDEYSMLSVVSAIEPLRVANRLAGEKLYEWAINSETGEAVGASNNLILTQPATVDLASVPDYTFVCAGMDMYARDQNRLNAFLNRRSNAGAAIGAVSMGAIFLARAGLLDGKKCTIHWEGYPTFMEEFPEIDVTNSLYEIDGGVMTCAGGVASCDLFLEIIKQDHPARLTRQIANQLQFAHRRSGPNMQTAGTERNLETAPKTVLSAISLINRHIEDPLEPSILAEKVGASRRTLERQFVKHTGLTPSKYCKIRRLERARHFLLHSSMSILEVAMATGFKSGSYFSVAFSEQFGVTPSELKKK